MRAAICDDDKTFRDEVAKWVLRYDEVSNQVVTFSNGDDLLNSRDSFDVIFLDIDMEGLNGIDTARKLRRRDKHVKIIFVTSYSDYVDGAFSVHAFSYLLKPVTKEIIYRQIDEVLSYIAPMKTSEELEFQTKSGLERLRTDEIYYFEYISRHIIIHSEKGVFQFKGKIAEVSKEMEKYGFALPHKSYVVNLYHVKSLKGYELKMMNGDIVPLSQKRSPEFRQRHSNFLASFSGEDEYE